MPLSKSFEVDKLKREGVTGKAFDPGDELRALVRGFELFGDFLQYGFLVV